MDEAPEREASAKFAQHMVVAVQVAEAVLRLRQHRIEERAEAAEQTASASRAERTAQHAADRVVWSRALDPEWIERVDLSDLGRAWGAAAGWADTDPTADVAARRVETRLSDMAPNAMARFDGLRQSGTGRVNAMHDVLSHIATESGHYRRVFVAEPGGAAQAHADTAAYEAWQFERTPDDRTTRHVDEHAEGFVAARPLRDEQATWQAAADLAASERQVGYIIDLLERSPGQAGDGPTDPAEIAKMSREAASAYIEALGGQRRTRRSTEAGHPHPADVAADSYPRTYTDVQPPATKPGATAAAAPRSKSRTLSRR